MRIVLKGEPRTKKNSQQIVKLHGHYCIIPSKAYKEYEQSCLWQIRRPAKPIGTRVNVKCIYCMPTKRRVDLCNLLEATCDILVKAGVLADDNSAVVMSHDGSRVLLDKENPRTEIEITEGEDINVL